MNDVVETIVQKHQAAARSEPKYAHCLALRPPKDGFIIETDCTSQDEKQLGHKCHFGCQQGFALQGSTILNCTPTGWSAAVPRCKKATCSRLQPTEGMNIEPIHCKAGDIRPGVRCDISCWDNYVFSNPATKTIHLSCKRDGLWTRTMPSCIPTAMYLVCPKDSTVSLSPTESTIWKTLPVVSSTPDYATTFTPVRRTKTGDLEFQLKLGSNKIDISAQSRITGEVKKCSTTINVVDNTPPVPKYCPKSVIKHTQLDRRFRFDPRFQDNTGITRIDVDGLPDEPITPGEYLVTYRAIDKFGNTGVCQVQLLAERPLTRQINQTYSTPKTFDTCEDLTAPQGGKIQCKKTRYGKLCRLSCEDSRAFRDGSTRKIYFCDARSASWRPNQVETVCGRRLQEARTALCQPGFEQVYGKCVACEPGTFRIQGAKCEPCPRGTFQSGYGSTKCRSCPRGMSNGLLGAKNLASCYARTRS